MMFDIPISIETIKILEQNLKKEKGFYEVSGINEFIVELMNMLFVMPSNTVKRSDYIIGTMAFAFVNYKSFKISEWLLSSNNICITAVNIGPEETEVIDKLMSEQMDRLIESIQNQQFLHKNKIERKITNIEIILCICEVVDNRYSIKNIELLIYQMKRQLGFLYRLHLGLLK